jgi:curved DNA-binding protein CbpA
MKDYYKVLEVSQYASLDEIKQQYRFLVHAWHPDKFPNPSQKDKAETKLKEINEAYDVIGNPEKRYKYDQMWVSHSSADKSNFQERAENWDEKAEAYHRQQEYERQQREKAEAERRRADYQRQQQENVEREKLNAERSRVEKYGIEVIICPSCDTINSMSFVKCIKCMKDISKEKPVNNTYHYNGSDPHKQVYRQQREQPKPRGQVSAERKRIEACGIEVITCPFCGAYNSLAFTRCVKCSTNISKEKPVKNPYL